MIKKICFNANCEIGKTATMFNNEDKFCPYCNGILELQKLDFDLDNNSLLGYENYVNDLFDNFNPQKDSLLDYSKYFSFIGSEYFNQTNWSKSLFYFQKALFVTEKISENCDKEIETIHDNLGSIYVELGQPSLAIEHFQICLTIQEILYDKDDLLLGWTHNNLANAYFSIEDLENSIHHYKEAISINKSTNSADYNSLITLYNNIGNALLLKSDFEDAINFYRESLSICHNHLESTNPQIGFISSKLGEAFGSIGDFENAAFYNEIELEIAIPLFDNNDLAFIYWKLGNCYEKMNNYTKAINNYLIGFEKCNRKAGGFPFKIGNCFEALNKLNDALEYYFITFEIRINQLGVSAKETIEAVNEYNRLGFILDKKHLNVNEFKSKL